MPWPLLAVEARGGTDTDGLSELPSPAPLGRTPEAFPRMYQPALTIIFYAQPTKTNRPTPRLARFVLTFNVTRSHIMA